MAWYEVKHKDNFIFTSVSWSSGWVFSISTSRVERRSLGNAAYVLFSDRSVRIKYSHDDLSYHEKLRTKTFIATALILNVHKHYLILGYEAYSITDK